MSSLPFDATTFEHLKDVVLVLDESLNIAFLNAFAADFFETKQKEILAKRRI